MADPETRTGSCLCGAIRYTLTGPPFFTALCHCENCRKWTGSAFAANAGYNPSQLTFTHGGDQLKTYRDERVGSGKWMDRSFCPQCGSPLRLEPARGKGMVVVPSGTLDEYKGWKPGKEYYKEGRAEWLPELELDGKGMEVHVG